MSFPAEHFGVMKKRHWYKVKWTANPPGMNVRGMFDLLMDTEYEKFKDFVQVIEKVQTESCIRGLPVGFGKKESEIDAWTAKNRQ